MPNLLRSALILAAFGATGIAQAAVIPANVKVTEVASVPALNTWYRANVAGTGTVAEINGSQARNGNGSVEMALSGGNSSKADYVFTWGYVPGRTLGNLNTLGFDWFRATSSDTTAHLAPAMRLRYDRDGLASTTDDLGYLIWEHAYIGTGAPTAAPENTWVSSDILQGDFWQRQSPWTSPTGQKFAGVTIEDYNIDLTEWMNGSSPANADKLGAGSAILGIEFGIGSGWSNSFQGNVDNVRFGFAGQTPTNFNFELAAADVPEPASLALFGQGVLGFAAARRRKQK
ncbi:PEP-CTERM sorting domain-containing protein [Massilia yuzhufengensis]|uniref:PEP-CTERM protein-sorting domain-containing protein n=1 Tax=Massilia yuzhufengensis TaxID=1164594 RepID=A0A1I1GR69_9BURK|nr:PEP-CTERM sorting domain-containing protein [Massilia yuzhufengensis]SFC14134.1 PEP-CTERM protein-sorting domain-containing protein [Massilia yuzhufengensis]